MSDPRQTRISIPGEDEGGIVGREDHNSETAAESPSNNSAVDIIVYFMDKVGIQLKVIDGQNVEAGELFELVLDEIPLSTNAPEAAVDNKQIRDELLIATAREVFSLWLVSDLLDLQLKSSHVPFKLICYWEELLEKYTSATDEERQRDEPVIMFKRNVFYPRADEKKIENERMLKLLYCEAKDNILRGRYPLSQVDCDNLASLQAVINLRENKNADKQLDVDFGTAAYFKSVVSQYLPPHLTKRNWIFKTSSNPECRLAQSYTARVQRGDDTRSALSVLYKEYLEFCWKLPFYGAAFFRGQAEHPGKRGPLSPKVDDPVYVAINVDGVFIIDMDDVISLLNLYYEDLSWQLVESSNLDNPNCLPCLFLQFPDTEKKSRKYSKLLQIFSREAMLMDNLIEACIQLRKTLGLRSSTAARPGDGADVDTERDAEIFASFQRLALITLDEHGGIVNDESTVRLPKHVK